MTIRLACWARMSTREARRPRLPADRGPRHSPAQRLGPGVDEAATSGWHLRSLHPRTHLDSRLPPRREVRRRHGRSLDDPVSIRAGVDRLRHLPLRRREAHADLRQAWRAPYHRRRDRRAISRCGHRMPGVSASFPTPTLGRPPSSDAQARRSACGRFSSRARGGREVQVRAPVRARRNPVEVGSVRLRVRVAAAQCRRSSSAPTTNGATRVDAGPRRQGSWFDKPLAVYEVHLGSWARVPEQGIAISLTASSRRG